MKRIILQFIFLCSIAAGFLPAYGQSGLMSVHLTCESHVNPLGIDRPQPRLSWQMTSNQRAQHQTAYQVLVASSPDLLAKDKADMWDSKKQQTGQSLYILYDGEALQSSTTYYWKVRLWDRDGKVGSWSKTANFTMGILAPDDWQAQWIGQQFVDDYAFDWQYGQWIGAPGETMGEAFFRKSFDIEDHHTIRRAVLRLSSPNQSRVYVNDRLVKACMHWPGMHEIDLDFWLKSGKNQLAIQAIDKAENRPVIMASLMLERTDGSRMVLLSDTSWRVKATSAPSEWAMRFFYDKNWENAQIVEAQKPGKTPDKGPRSIYLRKEFKLKNDIDRALVHVTGLGSYQLYINGRKVSDELLTPGWTEFDCKVEYQTYNVADYLNVGNNVIGIMLGNNWWGLHLKNFGKAGIDTRLKALLQLEVQYEDGKQERVITDKSWQSAPSPVLMNHLYHGEVYDFAQKQTGWHTSDFDATGWENVLPIDYKAKLGAHQAEPIRVTETLAPESIRQTSYGSYIVDFGQNMAGWVKLRVPQQAGKKIMVQYAELLYPDGSLQLGNLRTAKSMNKYLLTGDEEGWLQPHFTYHGFRWVEIFGYPEALDQADIKAEVIHTDLQTAGTFECSNPLFNQIWQNELWTFRSNFYAVPTDCPQRDERLGWMADAGNIPQVACCFMQVDRYFDKWVDDMEESQAKGGHMPDFSPAMGGNQYGSKIGAPGWADAAVKVPYNLFLFYGDTAIIRDHYAAMKQHVDDMIARSRDNRYEQKGWGDWLAIEPSPSEPFGTAFFYYSTSKLAEMARIIGKDEDAKKYNALAEDIAQAYQKQYFNTETQTYSVNTQTMNVLPVHFGITPEDRQEAVMAQVVADIKAHENHFTTGFLGTTMLFPELSRFGYDELAYSVVNQRDYPSWGRIIDEGATTITEAWNAYMGDDFASHSHFNLGSVTEWFFMNLAGIQPVMIKPGFKHFIIRPVILKDLDYVKASYESPYGTIRSHWEKQGDQLLFRVSVPPNTTAGIYVPFAGRQPEIVKEEGLKFIAEMTDGYWLYEARSGDYTFKMPYKY